MMNFNMLYSTTKRVLTLTALLTVTYSCSDDNLSSENGNLKLSAKSTVTSARANKVVNSNIEITKFLINIKEIELEVDLDDKIVDLTQNGQDWDDDGQLDSNDELELKGPFEIDLLSGKVSFLNIDIPIGNYEEIEFKFDRSINNKSELFGKSILIEGKIGKVSFKYSHNFTEKVEIDFEDPKLDILISEVDKGIVIDFDLNQLFHSVNGVDLTQAVDGNNNGVIEIDHSNIDGNKILANSIRKKITEVLDLLDD